MRVLVLLCLIGFSGFCQKQELRVLFSKLKTAQADTQKINALNVLTKLYIDFNLDSAYVFNRQSISITSSKTNERFSYRGISYTALILRKRKKLDSALIIGNKALDIAKKYNVLSEQANAYNLIGTIYGQLNKNKLASENFSQALKISSSIRDKKEMLSSYLHLGIQYKKTEDITNALLNLLEAMKISEELKDSSTIFTTCINLGTMYERTLDHLKAMECYRKALLIVKNDKNKEENDLAICYFKIGKSFQGQKQIDSAKYYLNETLKIHLKLKDEIGLIFDYSNIASFNAEVGDFENAEKNYLKALDLGLKNKDSIRLNLLYSYLGAMYKDKTDYNNALKYYKIALQYATDMVSKETIMQQHKKMSEIYTIQKKYKEALESYMLFKTFSDLSYDVNETKKQTELKLNYEFEQTQKKIETEAKAKELINKAELEQERKQRNYLLIGLAIISMMFIVTIKNYRAKQKANTILHKQKVEIERQKKLVEVKNQEINDSINYALRIQTASIPKASELDTFLRNYDLFFKPKDVVSGDFYWAEAVSLKNFPVTNSNNLPQNAVHDFSLVAVGDCTGHGVPGAITSMIGSMLLNEIFNVKKIYLPNEVLTELNRLVKLTLRQDSASLTNDGMDIAFCLLNNTTNELYYSGANRPLYTISQSGEFKEYKATKMSIGGQVPLIQSYELHKIQLQKGDTIVLSTDGYADQFGGKKEKKFTTKAFRNILATNYQLSPKELKQVIEKNYYSWKSDYEQTDDVLVFIIQV